MNTQIEAMKRRAKSMARDVGIPHQKALEIIARREGHATWGSLMRQMATSREVATILTGRPATSVRGASIAELIETLLVVLNNLVRGASTPYVDDFGVDNIVHVGPTTAWSGAGMTHDQGHEINGIQEELRRMSDVVSAHHHFFMHMAYAQHGDARWSPVTLELRGDNGLRWMSQMDGDRFEHQLYTQRHYLIHPTPSDEPSGWLKTSELLVRDHIDGGERFDPIDWGFQPSGLLMRDEKEEVKDARDNGVIGCLYEIDPTARPLSEHPSWKGESTEGSRHSRDIDQDVLDFYGIGGW